MAAPRSSPLRAFKQPTTPKMESNASQLRMRSQVRQQSAGSGPLRLPGLPRFHPANFPSSHSSMANTPTSGGNSPQPPMSPRAQQRYQSEIRNQLYSHHQSPLHRRTPSSQKPTSPPRLRPMDGSPGPVTPLELEADNYLAVGSGSLNPTAQAEYVDKLIREQSARSRRERDHSASPRRGSGPSVGFN
ncbi:Arginine permease [Venturia nashicola]|uniref:Arginine permease n=1 Tax=Venturia nashicola TaxID=86259 RepID=A0A4Z1NUF4_9PEZI|nr:Arginine permease [Venturia nashicola]TLD28088.1 Arginine permease [Venturia nashicola]